MQEEHSARQAATKYPRESIAAILALFTLSARKTACDRAPLAPVCSRRRTASHSRTYARAHARTRARTVPGGGVHSRPDNSWWGRPPERNADDRRYRLPESLRVFRGRCLVLSALPLSKATYSRAIPCRHARALPMGGSTERAGKGPHPIHQPPAAATMTAPTSTPRKPRLPASGTLLSHRCVTETIRRKRQDF